MLNEAAGDEGEDFELENEMENIMSEEKLFCKERDDYERNLVIAHMKKARSTSSLGAVV